MTRMGKSASWLEGLIFERRERKVREWDTGTWDKTVTEYKASNLH